MILYDPSQEASRDLVVPLSAVRAPSLFAALEEGRTVYVSRHGSVVSAFRPYDVVPDSLAALVSTPGPRRAPHVTPKLISEFGVSGVVGDAEAGLPALVTKNGHLYGMLVRAEESEAPSLATHDRNAVAARSQAVLAFRQDNPEATDDDVADFAASWSTGKPNRSKGGGGGFGSIGFDPIVPLYAPATPDHPEPLDDEWTQRWLDRGSVLEVEDEIEHLRTTVTPSPRHTLLVTHVAEVLAASLGGSPNIQGMFEDNTLAGVLRWKRLADWVDAEMDPANSAVTARWLWGAVAGLPQYRGAALWELGDLCRRLDDFDEAAVWYSHALDEMPAVQATSTVI